MKEVVPGRKADKVKELQGQGKLVAMVGDGITVYRIWKGN